ncbi:GNAT family N-acetyltransferase [Sphingobacterium sp. MYb382]|uniref:GNAT family N-acetyltransferase n=1 Tax=Sphingobacterium sp. MYb382 TaxID=2745278 RepID=UPI00309F5CCA
MHIRNGSLADLRQIKELAIAVWTQFKDELTPENWTILHSTLVNEGTYVDLLMQSDCFVCVTDQNEVIGFAFLVASGNPTDIYSDEQAYIRFVTVSKNHGKRQVGQRLTEQCIRKARENGEKILALHTSEMMLAARHIYAKLEFQIVRELEPRLGKRYWLYELVL